MLSPQTLNRVLPCGGLLAVPQAVGPSGTKRYTAKREPETAHPNHAILRRRPRGWPLHSLISSC